MLTPPSLLSLLSSVNLKTLYWSHLTPADLEKLPRVLCVRVQSLLTLFAVTHINLWILDIEGGELEAVNSVDWAVTTIDVICVEAGFEAEKDNKVRDVLVRAGFSLHTSQTLSKEWSNWWFVHTSFTPVGDPGLPTK